MINLKNKIFLQLIVGFVAGLCNGLLGSGGGTIIVPFMTECLNTDEEKAHATAVFIVIFITAVSLIFYGFNSFLDYKLALIVSVGGVAGGIVGAKLLIKLPKQIIRKIFGFIMILAACKMVAR